jgi:hypothetical protein
LPVTLNLTGQTPLEQVFFPKLKSCAVACSHPSPLAQCALPHSLHSGAQAHFAQVHFPDTVLLAWPASGAASAPPNGWGREGSSQESRESQSKIPASTSSKFRPSRPENFDHRSSIHRNPIPPRFTEMAAELGPSARCTETNRCCAVPQPRHFVSKASGPCKTSGKCSVLEN